MGQGRCSLSFDFYQSENYSKARAKRFSFPLWKRKRYVWLFNSYSYLLRDSSDSGCFRGQVCELTALFKSSLFISYYDEGRYVEFLGFVFNSGIKILQGEKWNYWLQAVKQFQLVLFFISDMNIFLKVWEDLY